MHFVSRCKKISFNGITFSNSVSLAPATMLRMILLKPPVNPDIIDIITKFTKSLNVHTSREYTGFEPYSIWLLSPDTSVIRAAPL